MDIGKRIKQLRIQNDLTLEELASRTELSKGFISQLEHNSASPSIVTLEYITEALGTTMSDFFQEEKEDQVVFKKDDFFVDEQDELTINWIVPNAQKNEMEPILLEIKPNGKSQRILPYEGEEFGYVLSGRVELCRSGFEPLRIRQGETFYIKGDHGHYLRNTSSQIARVLWICTPPVF